MDRSPLASSLIPATARDHEAEKAREAVRSLIEKCLADHLSPITASSVVIFTCRKLGVSPVELDKVDAAVLLDSIAQSLSLYLSNEERRLALTDLRRALVAPPREDQLPSNLSLRICGEGDVTLARGTALRMALSAGFDKPDSVKVSTVVSELTRNILQYAKDGTIDIATAARPLPMVKVVASDHGPGIPNVEDILLGRYRSRTGMGLGLAGSKRLMDSFEVRTTPGEGTTITATKYGRSDGQRRQP